MTDEDAYKYYNCKRWRKKRQEILRRDHWECQRCRERVRTAAAKGEQLPAGQRRIRKAVCVHHVLELKDRPDLAYDNNNLISLCHRCHDEIHGRSVDDFKMYRYTRQRPLLTEEKW